jgi:choloylglycine hydrolase
MNTCAPRAALLTTFVLVAILLVAPQSSFACTRVFWNDDQAMTVARTFDWAHSFDDWLLIYPRGIKMVGDSGPKAAKWTSKYGSVVANIYGYAQKLGLDANDGASDGINEKGLAAHLLYLEATKYSQGGKRPSVNYLRWVRYVLDNFATVAEAVEGMKKVDITSVELGDEAIPLHMAVEDPSGDSAVFEIIDGKLVTYHGKQYTTMANDPSFEVQLENVKRYVGLGGDKEIPGDAESPNRFVRAAYYLKYLPTPSDSEQAVGMVMSVARAASVPFGAPYNGRAGESVYPTWWVSATDLKNRVYYFSWVQNPNVVWVDLAHVDFSQGSPIKRLNPRNPAISGDVTRAFEPI